MVSFEDILSTVEVKKFASWTGDVAHLENACLAHTHTPRCEPQHLELIGPYIKVLGQYTKTSCFPLHQQWISIIWNYKSLS